MVGSILNLRCVDDIREQDGHWRTEMYVFRVRIPRASREYDCDFCCEKILTNQRHVMFVTIGQEGPGWETWRMHGECYQRHESIFENSGRPNWRWNPENA
jgi:hypothetical protein